MEGIGWIKLHRKIMSSETFECLNAIQKLIAIYIILNANHEDGVWHDKYKNVSVQINRGQLITSRSKIVNEWFGNDKEVTEQKVRTALKKLEKIGFLTMESTKAYTLISLCNYSVYQQKENETNQELNHELTKHEPSANHELTTNKNVKNEKNEKKDIQQQQGPADRSENWIFAYEMNYGQPTMKVIQLMNSYLDDGMDQKILSYAIEKAAENGQQFHYAKGIINKWITKGVLTYEAAAAEEEEYKKRKVERIHVSKRPQTNRPTPNIKGSDLSQYDFSKSRNSL